MGNALSRVRSQRQTFVLTLPDDLSAVVGTERLLSGVS